MTRTQFKYIISMRMTNYHDARENLTNHISHNQEIPQKGLTIGTWLPL